MIQTIPYLGAGLSYRSVFSSEIFKHQEEIDFLEIVADHYIDAPVEKLAELDLLRKHFVLIPHAINLSLGSSEGIDESYLKKLASVINRIDPPYWSEHISFTKAGGIEIGHLSPVPFQKESLEVLWKNIDHAARFINKPLILENISYLVNLPSAEMKEEEFLNRLLSKVDCGLLLDVTNLFYNSSNHQYDLENFLSVIPKEKIVQLHFTGGIYREGKFIDNHSSMTPDEVWSVMKKVLAIAKVKGVILERDDSYPDFSEILHDIEKAKAILNS
jgi:uncharacterized protein (UPF0276 family)